MMTRAFLALEISPAARQVVARLHDAWRRELPPVRWVPPENQHLTLKFLGEVEDGRLTKLAEALRPGLEGLRRVSVTLAGTGFFPTPQRPRVAWIGGSVEGIEPVVEAVETTAAAFGWEREQRPWTLHLTQARLRKPWPRGAVQRFLAVGETLRLDSFVCSEAVLFASELAPTGAVYTALERMSLA